MKTYVYIDASNLFYGGEKSLGWKIDYKKLHTYLQEKYGATRIFYFGGVEIHDFPYDYQKENTVPVDILEVYLCRYLEDNTKTLSGSEVLDINHHLKRIRFYRKIQEFGYVLYLKPVKIYRQDNLTTKRKANCDVDMAFRLMELKEQFGRVVVLSGDGDFLPVLKHLRECGREVIILGRSKRTAKEIRQFAGSDFRDFEYLETHISYSHHKQ